MRKIILLYAMFVCFILLSCDSITSEKNTLSNNSNTAENEQKPDQEVNQSILGSIISRFKAPDEQTIQDMIPDELLNYTYDGKRHVSSISEVKIVRQQTNEKDDICECDVILEDEIMERVEHITFYSRYWDKGGWQLDRWNEFDREEYELMIQYDDENFLNLITGYGYNKDSIVKIDNERIINEYGYTITPKNVWSGYEVDDAHDNLTAKGRILINAHLNASDEYPKNYTWKTTVDESEMEFNWNIKGIYTGNFNIYMHPYEYLLTIQLCVDECAYRGRYTDTHEEFYRIYGELESTMARQYREGKTSKDTFDNLDHAIVSGDSMNNICLVFDPYIEGLGSSARINMYFLPDSAYGIEVYTTFGGEKRIIDDTRAEITKLK